jgi:hypothetical protein
MCVLVINHYHILGRLELTALVYIVHVDCLLQDGLLRVLLDGGPTRGFAAGDSTMLEEDVNVLKVALVHCMKC